MRRSAMIFRLQEMAISTREYIEQNATEEGVVKIMLQDAMMFEEIAQILGRNLPKDEQDDNPERKAN